MTPTIIIKNADGSDRIVPLNGSVSVGRSPDCTLVLDDPELSWNHFVLWVEHGVPWIRDLESRNGTYIGEQRVVRATPLSDGNEVVAGAFRATVRCTAAVGPATKAYAINDVATGLRHVIRGDRFRIGPDDTDDLRIDDIESHTILVHDGGEVWLGDEELKVDEERTLGPLTFRLVTVDSEHQSTIDAADNLYSYKVAVDLNGQTGPEAHVGDPRTGVEHVVDATNRAILLYVLAKQWDADRKADLARAQRGWCVDDDLIIGVWGKSALAEGGGKLKALLHRLRVELKGAGFDPWFIEKKRGYTRIRVAEVVI